MCGPISPKPTPLVHNVSKLARQKSEHTQFCGGIPGADKLTLDEMLGAYSMIKMATSEGHTTL